MKALTLAILQISAISTLLFATSVQAAENTSSARLSAQQEAEAAAIQARMIAARDEEARAKAAWEKAQADKQRQAQSSTLTEQAKENVQQRLTKRQEIYRQLENIDASPIQKSKPSVKFVPMSAELRAQQQQTATRIYNINQHLIAQGRLSADEIMQAQSELDKTAQAKEFTESVIVTYGGIESIERLLQMILTSAKSKFPNQSDDLQCIDENFDTSKFIAFSYQASKDYIALHSAEDVQKDLIILIDSDLTDELGKAFSGMTNGDDEASLVFKLRLMQNPRLSLGYQYLNNKDTTNQLPYFFIANNNGILMDFVDQAVQECVAKLP